MITKICPVWLKICENKDDGRKNIHTSKRLDCAIKVVSTSLRDGAGWLMRVWRGWRGRGRARLDLAKYILLLKRLNNRSKPILTTRNVKQHKMDLRQPKQLHLFLYFFSLFLFFAYGVSRATRQAQTSLQVMYNSVQSEV